MKNMKRVPLASLLSMICALALLPTIGAAQQPETLGTVRQKYLNQKVVLIGHVSAILHDQAGQPVVSGWNLGTEAAGRYSADMKGYLPATFKGQTATVIAIQLHDLQKQGKVNALGESISEDDIVNPYIDFVVRFDNDIIAMTLTFPSNIFHDVKLASDQNAIAQEMAAKLPGVVGKSFYACGFTRLYRTDTTLEELLGTYRIVKQLSNVPFLVPLKVTAAKYDETANAVILKVKLPDGREALSVASGSQLTEKDSSFFQRISGYLTSEFPKKFTPQEIAAIKKQSVFRGMSMNALYYSLGLPESENDWGRGGKQFVYTDRLMVYLNNLSSII